MQATQLTAGDALVSKSLLAEAFEADVARLCISTLVQHNPELAAAAKLRAQAFADVEMGLSSDMVPSAPLHACCCAQADRIIVLCHPYWPGL